MSAPAPPDPGFSMSLLTDLVRDAVRSDYGDPGERPAETPAQRRRWTPWTLGALLVAGLVLAAAAVQTRAARPATQAQRSELGARVSAATTANADLDATIRALRDEVAAAEQKALADTAAGRDPRSRTGQIEAAAGYTPVTGSGAEVVLRDAEKPTEQDGVNLGRVLDRDVQTVVNGLWRSGATAVAVNDHRMTSRTAIRSAGDAILVDYRPLQPPYRIDALGPADLAQKFGAGTAAASLQDLAETYGVRWSVAAKDALTLPPGDSPLPRHAEVLGGTP